MRIAIPTFGNDVSPRFCFAQEMLVVDVIAGVEKRRLVVGLGDTVWPERLSILCANRVDVLLCRVFPRRYLPNAEAAGIRIVSGLGGSVESVLEAFFHGNVQRMLVAPPLQDPACAPPRRHVRRHAR